MGSEAARGLKSKIALWVDSIPEDEQHWSAQSLGLNTNLPLLPAAEPLGFSLLTPAQCICLAFSKSLLEPGIRRHMQPHTQPSHSPTWEGVHAHAGTGHCFILFLYPGPSFLLPSMFSTYPALQSHSKINILLKYTVERVTVLETHVLPTNWLNARMSSSEKC